MGFFLIRRSQRFLKTGSLLLPNRGFQKYKAVYIFEIPFKSQQHKNKKRSPRASFFIWARQSG
jgi:hypothetical protein